MVMIMWLGLLIPFFGTTLGSAVVFFIKNKKNELLSRCFSGIASGVMVAASIWSLLIPAMNQEKNILVIVLGIFLGALLLLFLDCIVPHMHPGTNDEEGKESHFKKTTKLVFAVTLHNIPEGMAIGVAFGSIAYNLNGATLTSAVMLAIGIGIQNFPEGSAVSLPLRREGMSRTKSFFFGALSGIVEPISAVIGAILVLKVQILLPILLSFAGGAMIYVVVQELIPESQTNKKKDLMALFTILGFLIMMIFDVALG